MKLITKIVAVVAAATVGTGAVAGGASAAYDFTGGSYAGVASAQHSFTLGGAYTLTCDAAFAGNTENVVSSPAETDMTPSYSNCDFFGLPATVTAASKWVRLTITTDWPPLYIGLDITLFGVVVIEIPIVGCTVSISGPQAFPNGVGGNVITGVNAGSYFALDASIEGIDYTTSGSCPFGAGSDGAYTTNGDVTFDGVGVDIS